MREGQELLEAAVTSFRGERGEVHAEGLALRQLANVMRQQGKMDEARQALKLHLRFIVPNVIAAPRASSCAFSASCTASRGGCPTRNPSTTRPSPSSAKTAIAAWRAFILGNIGILLAERGDFAGAKASFEAALAIHIPSSTIASTRAW